MSSPGLPLGGRAAREALCAPASGRQGTCASSLLAACTRHNHPEPSNPPLVIGNAHKWCAFVRDRTSFQHNLRTSINTFYIVHWDSERLRPRDLTWPTPTTINHLLPLILATMRLIRLNPIAGNQLAFVPQSLGRVIYQPMAILDAHWSLKRLIYRCATAKINRFPLRYRGFQRFGAAGPLLLAR
ncbi:hypothetical protein PCANC_22872 [Puccinia coronata f. sp. avenae]|uniref:Uncharacterized protein n=1 Tax=Puccinia coronata f. sp. avenae TaxID=200324 RepID=A0A2N5U700_9BASI|nr:hypothetical protein PCANC_22872 [Puccinia coronata f. sp. avenae]PLW35287.1 hypothetical protein PCASD_13679 [Puccinia coronata f. sp. avenae]